MKPRLCEGSLAPGCSLAEASEQRKREMAEQKKELTGSSAEDYFVRKTNGRLGLTIYAHNDDGVIRAEVRGVTSFAPRCAQVGDSVVAVDSELISSVRCASDVEKLLRIGKVIHLRRKTPLPPKVSYNPISRKVLNCSLPGARSARRDECQQEDGVCKVGDGTAGTVGHREEVRQRSERGTCWKKVNRARTI